MFAPPKSRIDSGVSSKPRRSGYGSPARQNLMDIVKKYRPDTQGKDFGNFKRQFMTENKQKEEKLHQLDLMHQRMHQRVEEHVKFQRRIREEEQEKIKWVTEEYKRVKLENSCMALEKIKLKMQIEKMRLEVEKLIEGDQEKLEYFIQGIPIENKNETNFSDIYTFGKVNNYKVERPDQKPISYTVTKKATRMGDFVSSPNTKVHDTYVPDHRRYEKVKDAGTKEILVYQGENANQALQSPTTCHLLNRIKMRKQKSPDKPAFKNLINGDHKLKGSTLTSKINSTINSPNIGPRQRLGSKDSKTQLRALVGSPALSNYDGDRSVASMGITYMSTNGVYNPNANTSAYLDSQTPNSKADQVMTRVDQMAKDLFGDDYIDWVGILAELAKAVYKIEKKFKKFLRCQNRGALIALNIVLVFKKAFYILQFHHRLAKTSKVKFGTSKRSIESADDSSEFARAGREIDTIYEAVCELSHDMNAFVKGLVNPIPLSKEETLKLSDNAKPSAMGNLEGDDFGLAGWTPQRSLKTETEIKGNGTEFSNTDAGGSISTPQSSSHLVSLDSKPKKKKFFDVTFISSAFTLQE